MPQYLVTESDAREQAVVGEFEAVNPEQAVEMAGMSNSDYVTVYVLGTDPYGNVNKLHSHDLEL